MTAPTEKTPQLAAFALLLTRLNRDELRVLLRIGARLCAGRRTYGPLRLTSDRRAFRVEAREEIEDALVYLACA